MKIRLVAREATEEDVVDVEGGGVKRIGAPLRKFLAEMAENQGWVKVRLQTATQRHPENSDIGRRMRAMSTANPGVVFDDRKHSTVPYRVVDAQAIQVDLSRWKGRDPDSTYLILGWAWDPT